ncbi:MFS transporter [Raphidocelis subcapitata]|uniref:MFS transporter n=1 Tax=Raphidocelis subcapitata TaxID=307507 RepID=A0A2V0NL31_9CHLO|nr:MFS transporter [Raphidocelis subcapitata]|eukprot:GBF88096.1 MFS transporter [Raphidocelis subcapitata]
MVVEERVFHPLPPRPREGSGGVDAALRRAERRLGPRLLPMVALFAAVNYLDRTNLALASVELTTALALSPTQYALGASLFFVPYCLLQIPSQMLMAVTRRQNLWLAGLLVSWGTIATAMAGIRNVAQYYLMRVLLGVFEAGALPGCWAYLAHFYSKDRIALPLSVLHGSLIFSQALGPLIAAGLLTMDGVSGLEGWAWLFMLEGLAAIAVAIGWVFMPRDVEAVTALTPEELAAVRASFASTQPPARGGNQLAVLRRALANPAVAAACVIKFCRDTAFYGIIFWAPLIVKGLMGFSVWGGTGQPPARQPTKAEGVRVVLLVAVPFAAAAAAQFAVAWSSQRRRERRFHVAAAWGVGAAALLALPLALRSFAAGFVVLIVATVGTLGAEGTAIAHYMALQGAEKGLGMSLLNSVGALGGVVGPLLIGALKQRTGNYDAAMYILGGLLAAAAAGIAALPPSWAERWGLREAPGEGGAPKACASDAPAAEA